MNEQNTPALAGKNIRTLLVSVLFISIVAGAFVMPAMANPTYGVCMARCYGQHSPDISNPVYWSCHMDCLQHSSPDQVGLDPRPLCCYHPDDGSSPYCIEEGACTMNPTPT
jgi:hypothetical protein